MFGEWLKSTIEEFGVNLGLIDQSTITVGMFLILIAGFIGLVLTAMGLISRRVKTSPSWMAPFALIAVGVSMLEWLMIPGFPFMSKLGLVGGVVALVVAYLVYRNPVSGTANTNITLGLGIGYDVLFIAAMLIELFAGGGLLA